MRKPMLLLFFVLLFCVPALFLSGCFTFRYHVTVNRDGSVDTEITAGADRSLVAMGMAFDEEDIFEEIRADLIEDGYRVENYAENGQAGIRAYKSFSSLDEALVLESELLNANEQGFRIERGFLRNTYHLDLDIDTDDGTGDDWAMISLMQPEMAFLLTVPVEPQQHNANRVSADGKTLEWDLVTGRNIIRASFSEPAAGLYILLAAAFAALAGVAALSLVSLRRKKRAAVDSLPPIGIKKCSHCKTPARRGNSFCVGCGTILQPQGELPAPGTGRRPTGTGRALPGFATKGTTVDNAELFPEEEAGRKPCSLQTVSITWVGGVYRGQISAGRPEGRGELALPNGTIYSGSWKKGKPCGSGKTIYPSGAIYEGEFLDGKRHGRGAYTQPDGRRYAGRWDKGVFVG